MRTEPITESIMTASSPHAGRLALPVKKPPVIAQKRLPNVVNRTTAARIRSTQAALIADTARIHTIDVATSEPQSIDGVKGVGVSRCRRSPLSGHG